MALNFKCNDTRRAPKGVLINPKGEPVDLTDSAVKFVMVKYNDGGSVLVDNDAIILDAQNGVVTYVFEPEETTTAGTMKAEFIVTYPDGSEETFPSDGYIIINFESRVKKGV